MPAGYKSAMSKQMSGRLHCMTFGRVHELSNLKSVLLPSENERMQCLLFSMRLIFYSFETHKQKKHLKLKIIVELEKCENDEK